MNQKKPDFRIRAEEETSVLDQETLGRLSAGNPAAGIPAGAATGHIHDRCGGHNTYLMGHTEGAPNDFWWCLDCNCAFLVPRE